MKNEERIIEILAESLRKQDRQEELLTKLVESHLKQGETMEKHGTILERQGSLIEKQGVILEKQSGILEKQSGILGKLLEGQERLTTEFHRMNDHLLTKQEKMEDRIVRLENKVFKA